MKGLIDARLAELCEMYPAWEKKTIWEWFEATAKRFPTQEFIVNEDGETYTYEEARASALRVAGGLVALGVKPGDHVALQMENCARQVLVALAAAAVGAVKVPVNICLSAKELGFVLKQSDSGYLITGCKAQINDGTALQNIIVLPEAECEAPVPMIPWDEFLAAGEGTALPEANEGAADEPSDIIYTSGSTKSPKGVVLTHDMLMRSAFASCLNRGFEIGRRVFIPLPLFHAYGYVEGMLAAILVGGTILLRRGKFLAEPVLSFMLRSRANDILSVPAQMIALIEYLKENPVQLPDLHAVYCSASVCPAWVWGGIRQYLGVSDVITGYGMTEVCGASMQTVPGDGDDILTTRVGRILPAGCSGMEEFSGRQIAYRIVRPKTEEDCPPGECGELWCRGAVVTHGYYNRPKVNEKAFTADGWFKTGDCGYFDENGYLVFSGRIDDMYKINGENVSPKFLEDVFGNCPQISSSNVVGIPDEKHGYVGAAFLQLYDDTAENRDAAIEYAKMHLAKFQIPKYFIFMKSGDWPRTSTGKVQKFRLKQMVTAGQLPELIKI